MKKFALIGHNISYSLSPLIHGEIFRKMGLDATYELISVEKQELPLLAERLRRDYDGFNVTKPHKENIIPFLDGQPPKSVNTVRIENGKMFGFSTDGYGFTKDLKICFGDIGKIGGDALILGAGGVARVIIEELKNQGFDVYVWNRTRDKAEKLCEEFGVRFMRLQDIKPDLVVNCTSCGLRKGENPLVGADDDGTVRNLLDRHRVKWAYDTIYSPPQTDFLYCNRASKTANGLGMLILQAIESDRIMCGFDIDEMLEREIYNELMDKLTSKIARNI